MKLSHFAKTIRKSNKALPVETEFEAQCRVIAWARMMAETGQEPRLALLHGDSSGVRVSVGLAVKIKRAGAVKGFPDIFLPVPRFHTLHGEAIGNPIFYGLFIELKREVKWKLSVEQKDLHDALRDQGYHVATCIGADAAISLIKEYLSMQI